MGYEVEVIDRDTCDAYRRKYDDDSLFSAKADIGGVCVQLYTADRDHMEMWTDNFYAMSDHTRSHARLFCVTEPGAEMKVFFEPYTNTAFLINFDYYGWVKSIGLGIAGNILEESHGTFSIHGAALDIDGTGVTLIAPSKTGKTTQSFLKAKNAHLISDDWYFVRLGATGVSFREELLHRCGHRVSGRIQTACEECHSTTGQRHPNVRGGRRAIRHQQHLDETHHFPEARPCRQMRQPRTYRRRGIGIHVRT